MKKLTVFFDGNLDAGQREMVENELRSGALVNEDLVDGINEASERNIEWEDDIVDRVTLEIDGGEEFVTTFEALAEVRGELQKLVELGSIPEIYQIVLQ